MSLPIKPPGIPEDRWEKKLKATATGAVLVAFGVAAFLRSLPPHVSVSLVILGLLVVDGEVLLAPLTALVGLTVSLIRAWRGTNGV